ALLARSAVLSVAASRRGWGGQLSVPRRVMVETPGPCAAVGVQVNWPVVALMLAPAGAPTSRLYVSDCGGTSRSAPLAVKVSRVCLASVLVPMGAHGG